MSIEEKIDANTAALIALNSTLAAYQNTLHALLTANGVAVGTVAVPTTPPPGAGDSAEKSPRGRKSKTESPANTPAGSASSQTTAAAPAVTQAPPVSGAPAPSVTTSSATTPTSSPLHNVAGYVDAAGLQERMREVAAAKGRDAVVNALAAVGAATFPDLCADSAKVAAFTAHLNALMAPAALAAPVDPLAGFM